MNIAIVGYGKMGKQIEKVLTEKKMNITSVIDKYNPDANFKQVSKESLKGIDVAIDFSSPENIMEHIKAYKESKVSVVMGTTGWFDKMYEVKKIIGDDIGFIWSGNFSIGVHAFFSILRNSARIFDKFTDYDVMACEYHHNEKKDSPSGTALMMGDILIDEMSRKEKIVTDRLDRRIEPNEIHLASIRGGYIPGTHVVTFDSFADSIEIKHTARNREGFAKGAVLAADWINGKKGFYSIDDFMDDLTKNN